MKLRYILVIIAYVAISVLFMRWWDAMDTRYGIGKAEQNTLAVSFLCIAWPVGIPTALFAVMKGGGGRWALPAKQEATDNA